MSNKIVSSLPKSKLCKNDFSLEIQKFSFKNMTIQKFPSLHSQIISSNSRLFLILVIIHDKQSKMQPTLIDIRESIKLDMQKLISRHLGLKSRKHQYIISENLMFNNINLWSSKMNQNLNTNLFIKGYKFCCSIRPTNVIHILKH